MNKSFLVLFFKKEHSFDLLWEESTSFLKKRSKKLLSLKAAR